jgi:serine/threonine-protein kinase
MQTSLQRRVALKVLQVAHGLAGAEDRAAFFADVQATAAVRDGVLVPVLESGTAGDYCYAALELVEGPSLSTSLATGHRMPWRELLPVLADVAQALHRIHEQGQVHGAVKPSNVFALLRDGGRLADLRAGTDLRPRETTAYSAPELLRGQPLDAHSDLYSLGCVAYAALTGRPPYWGSAKQILEEQRARRPADLTAVDPTMPRGLDALVCGQLLALDPADRPVSAAACRDALLALIGGGPGGADAAPAVFASPQYVAPAPVQVSVQRVADRDAEPAQGMRRQPSAAKSFGAKLAAEAIIFGMVGGVLILMLLLLKVATEFDLYEMFGVTGRAR